MDIFGLFKLQWSATQMTEEDRKKIFWHLQRKTSYTAWAREVDIFDNFVQIVERQVREQPHASGSMFGTDWPPVLRNIVKARDLYAVAMARLRTGDRTIFLRNPGGTMVAATTLSEAWHEQLIHHGMHRDQSYDGRYVPLMTGIMDQFGEACAARGYLQAEMDHTPAPEVWSPAWYERYATLRIPDDPPPLPQQSKILFRTGEQVPVSGIYEPQTRDGCMNYLLEATQAPSIWCRDGNPHTDDSRTVTWRLIWEDTRYRDGQIPAEEASYFLPRTPPVARENPMLIQHSWR